MLILIEEGVILQNFSEFVHFRDSLIHTITPENNFISFTEREEIGLRLGIWNNLDHLTCVPLQVVNHFVLLDVINKKLFLLSDDGEHWHIF